MSSEGKPENVLLFLFIGGGSSSSSNAGGFDSNGGIIFDNNFDNSNLDPDINCDRLGTCYDGSNFDLLSNFPR